MQIIGLVMDKLLQHHRIPLHPESPYRLQWLQEHLADSKLLAHAKVIAPKKVRDHEMRMVHATEYLQSIRAPIEAGYVFLDNDTGLEPTSFETACYAAGGVIEAVNGIMYDEFSRALCLVRPPGHHAQGGRALGFCLLNNVAIGVRYLQAKYDLKNIIVIDFDAHHGIGTQSIFYQDDSVCYLSLHEKNLFTSSGSRHETGSGPGEGYTYNFPLSPHSGEQAVMRIIQGQLPAIFARFDPQFIFLSAGFDGHWRDSFSSLRWQSSTYYKLTRSIVDLSLHYCEGRIVSVLEGGYDKTGLQESVAYHYRALIGEDIDDLMPLV